MIRGFYFYICFFVGAWLFPSETKAGKGVLFRNAVFPAKALAVVNIAAK